eukprot:1959030-Rhodomonas_salina.1
MLLSSNAGACSSPPLFTLFSDRLSLSLFLSLSLCPSLPFRVVLTLSESFLLSPQSSILSPLSSLLSLLSPRSPLSPLLSSLQPPVVPEASSTPAPAPPPAAPPKKVVGGPGQTIKVIMTMLMLRNTLPQACHWLE